MENKEIIIRINGKKQRNMEVVFMKRISGNGEVLIQLDLDYKPTLFHEFSVHCLSITHKTWIATDSMSTFIVKLRSKVTGHYLPNV